MNMRVKKMIAGITLLASVTGVLTIGIRRSEAESLNNNEWTYNERYRNQYHYSAEKNWLNDPNGLLYDDTTGIYHLFYQYNPSENGWGNMSWGHATSTDLVNWEEQEVVIPQLENQGWVDSVYTNTEGDLADVGEVHYVGNPTTNWGDANGKKYVFSGSTVLDKDNKSGLGKNAILAFYTSCYQVATRKNDGLDGGLGSWIGMKEIQEQHLAYSVDGGKTFQQYSPDGNSEQPKPVIPVTDMPEGDAKDFRDPKVVYDEEHDQWLMIVVAGQRALVYKSTNLIDWTYASKIEREHDYGVGVWECPELIPMNVEGTNETKWVLTMSVQDNAYASGSGMQYMVGDIDADGKWTPETNKTLSAPHWLDYGEDYYAGVTFGNMPQDRKVMLAWMSNWKYIGEQNTTPWYSHMALPRELTLRATTANDEGYELIQQPIDELSTLNKETIQLKTDKGLTLTNETKAKVTNYSGRNYRIDTELTWEDDTKPKSLGFYVRATDDLERKIYVGYDTVNQLAYVNRLSTGEPNIGGPVRDKTNAPVDAKNKIKLTAFVDESAIEVFVNDGERTISQVFYFRPELIGDVATEAIGFYSEEGKMTIARATVTPLRSIFGDITDAAATVEMDQYDSFDPLANPAFTSTSGNGRQEQITDINILENTVNAAVAGNYTVKYGVTNTQGKYQEMAKSVVVKENEALPESIKLNYSGIKSMKEGKALSLLPTFTPEHSSAKIIWSSSNDAVVSINEDGELRALKTGTTKITAKTANGKTATVTIRVSK